jgi:hypothetical protein
MTPLHLTPSPAQAKRARAGQRAMLAAEAELLHELQAAAQRALDALTRAGQHERDPKRARLRALAALRAATNKLRIEVARAVTAGRGAARDAAGAQLADELAAAAVTLKLTAIATPGRRDRADDEHRAAAAADAYVAAWRAGALVALNRWAADDERPALASALLKAHEQQDHRLRRTAATEVPQAYSEEHAGRADALAEEHRGAAWLVLLVKVWDATLDRKLCPVCANMDRRWAVVGGPFKGGLLPGAVHAHCRCQDSLLALKPGVMIPGAAYVGASAAA